MIPERQDTKIIAFYAEKGGVGKTTISSTLAFMLASNNKRVLIIDCDVQRSLTAWVFGTNINLIREKLGVNVLDNFINNHNHNHHFINKFQMAFAEHCMNR